MRRLLPLLALIALCSSGCSTAIGNYFGNRAKDFGECFRVHAGVGLGLGVDVKAAGLFHAGLIGGVAYSDKTLGWRYGELLIPGDPPPPRRRRMLGDFHTPISHTLVGRSFTPQSALHLGEGDRHPTIGGGVHGCWWLLPAAFSTVHERWLWSAEQQHATYARVHAFDIELGIALGVVHAQAGFSPGEFVDFLLGWFGFDIAGDDIAGDDVAWPPDE